MSYRFPMPPKILSSLRSVNIMLSAGFLLSAAAAVLIGLVLPDLARRLDIDDRQAGYFFAAQFAGSLAGTLASTAFARRGGFLPAAVFGFLAMSVGVLFLNFDSYWICLLGFFLNGIGVGAALPSINLLTLEINPKRGASALNVLNFYWGVGAIFSQPFVDILGCGTSIFAPTVALAVLFAAFAGIFYLLSGDIERKSPSVEEFSVENAAAPPIWTNPLAWSLALFNFIHVGFESGMSGWLQTYTERLDGEPTAAVISPILLYFSFFVAGRGVAPLFLRFLNENRLLLLNVLTVLVGTVLIIAAENALLLSLGAAVAGFGTSSIFPTNLSRFSKIFGSSANRRAAPLFICGTLGAASTTWLIGFVSHRFGNLRSGMAVLLFGGAALLALQIFLTLRLGKRESPGF